MPYAGAEEILLLNYGEVEVISFVRKPRNELSIISM